jgi:hypothetical protein
MATLQFAFVDWTFRNDEKTEAIGTLGGHQVTLTGQRTVATDAAPLGTAILNGTFPGFHTVSFTPPLPASDLVEIVGLRGGSSFRVEFDAEVKDPVIHLGSLASTLEFLDLPVGTEVTRLSGDAEFKVDGNKVMGEAFQPPPGSTEPTDSDGTVGLNGLFRSIAFTLKPRFTGGEGNDAVHLQIGGMVEAGSDRRICAGNPGPAPELAGVRLDDTGDFEAPRSSRPPIQRRPALRPGRHPAPPAERAASPAPSRAREQPECLCQLLPPLGGIESAERPHDPGPPRSWPATSATVPVTG